MELAGDNRVAEGTRWPTERVAPQDAAAWHRPRPKRCFRNRAGRGDTCSRVARLAVQLFDQTAALHELPDSARPVLQAGALGHDIGYQRSAKRHHKESFRLLRKRLHPLVGDELATMIACVARYHRKALPKSRHVGFRDLAAPARLTVERLAALLRIADGLDRAHMQRVRQTHSRISPVRWQLIAIGAGEAELWGAERKADLAERTFGRARRDRVRLKG